MQALHEIMEAEAEQLQHNKSRAAWEQICRLAGCNASAGAASVSDNVTRYLDERLAVMQRLEVAAEKKLRECQAADKGLADRARAEEELGVGYVGTGEGIVACLLRGGAAEFRINLSRREIANPECATARRPRCAAAPRLHPAPPRARSIAARATVHAGDS